MKHHVVTVTLPHPDKALSPNAKAPLSRRGAVIAGFKKTSAKKKAKDKAFIATKIALRGHVDAPTHYQIFWYYKGPKPDADNCLARCKAYLDGICEALGINDRDLECAGIQRVHSLTLGGNVDITLTKNSEVFFQKD